MQNQEGKLSNGDFFKAASDGFQPVEGPAASPARMGTSSAARPIARPYGREPGRQSCGTRRPLPCRPARFCPPAPETPSATPLPM